jgi:hypothetical protein
MNWIIQSKDRSITDITHHATEDGFRTALKALFSNPQKQFVSATLSDGAVLNEAAAKGFAIGVSGIGQTPPG